MRHTMLLLLSLCTAIACTSQTNKVVASSSEPVPQQPTPTPEASLGEIPTDSLLFVSDMEEAKALAEARDQDILLVFAGSDWCRPCKQFKLSVLDDSSFRQNFKDELLVLYLDFPSKRRNQLSEPQQAHNNRYAEQYNPEGLFPRLFLLDAGQETLGELKYAGEDAESFEAQLRSTQKSR